jgi:polyhydroxybutyrate depolymerase
MRCASMQAPPVVAAGAAVMIMTAAASTMPPPAPGARHASGIDIEGRCRPEPPAPGLATYTIDRRGAIREYAVYVPRTHDPARPSPLLVELHGSGSHPAQQLEISGTDRAAEVYGFIVVLPVAARLPQGITWNVPPEPGLADDVAFVIDVVDEVSRRLCIETARFPVAGFSGGARLGSALACRHADRVAALAAVAGLRPPSSCVGRVPVLAFHGTGDPVNPHAGGGPSYWGHGVEAAAAGWAANNGCGGPPVRIALGPGIDRLAHDRCVDGARVVLYELDGIGHVWPGSRFAFPEERFGRMSSLDATALALEFFVEHGPIR